MKIKPIALSALLFLAYYYGLSLLSIAVSLLPMYIARGLTSDEFIRTLSLTVAMVITMVAGLFFIFRTTGYRDNRSYEKSNLLHKFILPVLCSYAAYYFIALVARFFLLLYFPQNYLAIQISRDFDAGIWEFQKNHFGLLNVTFLIMLPLMFVPSLAGYMMGAKKRAKKRDTIKNT